MKKKKVKILYISGWGRSGSTLLCSLLGRVKGFFSAGEVRYIWERGFLDNRLCECGKQFRDCEFWHHVLHDHDGDFGNLFPEEIIQTTYDYTRTYNTFAFLNRKSRKYQSKIFEEYLDLLRRLYSSISVHSDSDVIVDSSKFPVYGAVLSLIPNFEIYYVHLIRDPRAVAYSWKTQKKYIDSTGPDFLAKINPFKSSTKWISLNLSASILGRFQQERYLRIRYEDLIQDPKSSISKILSFVGEEAKELPFEEGGNVISGKNNHIFAGNPDRFKSEGIRITPDIRWIKNLKTIDKFGVTMITFPFLLYWGYKLYDQ
ncbi:MAG: sulfotransferase [Chloroflexota bacterium]